ncbi:protein lin-52 homolog isoform X2 [Phlebotomus argentipes]|uniref:protein lin-52 homolog isoform X2 n=1 Tax=Phlebotomus argentipes TaxID=94469 RepID=UPI00289367C8|nr:protein lin-52 homolog isoform X2 [Phlebotomus argentipes]
MSSDEENSENSKHDKSAELEELLSLENLDRASPELWPEKSVTDFISSSNNRSSVSPTPPSWSRGLTSEDIAAMHKLGELTPTALALDLKKIYDQAYVLGVQEAKEMTRGKYLNIFGYDINKSIQQQQTQSKGFPATAHRKSSTSSD